MNTITNFTTRTQAWYDERPLLRGSIRYTAIGAGWILRPLLRAIAVGLAAATIACILLLIASWWLYSAGLTKPWAGTPTAVLVSLAGNVFTSVAIFSGAAALLVMTYRASSSYDEDGRPRAERARGIVAQCIVAHTLGRRVSLINLGLDSAGDFAGYYWFVEGETDWTDDRVRAKRDEDELTILLANPVLDSTSGARYPALEEVTALANTILVDRARATDVDLGPVDLGAIISEAAERAQRILAEYPDDQREAIENELRRAGTIREARFTRLLAGARAVEAN